MRYSIIKNRGVLKEGAPFIIDEGKPLELHFDDLPAGDYELVLSDKQYTKIAQPHKGDTALIDPFRLRAGVWHVELYRLENGKAVEKIICTPLKLDTLSTVARGLIAYPEIEDVLNRLETLERKVEELLDWSTQAAPKIHEHKIIK